MYSVSENITQNTYQVTVTEQETTYSVTVTENVSSYSVTFEQQIRMLPNLELEQRVEVIENTLVSWTDIAGNIRYTGVETTVTNGQVLTGIYNGSTIYRFINDTNDIYGYPIEDSFYSTFDGTNFSALIKTRG